MSARLTATAVGLMLVLSTTTSGQDVTDDLFKGYKAGMNGNAQQALDLLSRAIQVDPKHDRALATRAGVNSTLDRHDQADAQGVSRQLAQR